MYLSDRPRELAGPARAPAAPAARRGVGSTVLLLGLVSLLTDVSSESVSAVLPLYLTAVLGLSPLAYGFVDGLYQGVSALVRILGGWLSDRADRPKWVAFAGYALSAVTKALLLPANGLTAVTAVITLDRLGKGLRTAPRDAIIATATPPESRGRAFGVHRALDTTGAAVGPLLAFSILWLVPGDYRGVFVASLAAALLGLALLGLMVPDVRPRRTAVTAAGEGPAGDATATRPGDATATRPGNLTASRPDTTVATGPAGPVATRAPRPSWRTLAEPRFARVVAAAAVLGLLTISDGFLYLSLQQRDDFAERWFPLLFVGTNVAYLCLAVPCGRLADRVGRAKVMVGGHLLLLGAYLCAARPTGGFALTLACLLLLGAFYASTDGVLAALASTLVPQSIRASGIATAQTVVAVSRFGSSLLFGVLWSAWGRSPAVSIMAAGLLVGVTAAWLLLRNVEQPQRQGDAA
ncbi:MFS transporter [Pedococcus sp. 5OH_020]|uniref:MFS transporter n=1 Tax=Pedococcus sp. 5OH_020 TaxID=2989814 RepID=UPI0022E9E269|nr:MFS transporter [Pedococcus sp. 5OH_020]